MDNSIIKYKKTIQQVERLRTIADKIEKELRSITECSRLISDSWKGDNAGIYLKKTEAISYALKEVSDDIDKTAEEIMQAVKEIIKNDRKNMR